MQRASLFPGCLTLKRNSKLVWRAQYTPASVLTTWHTDSFTSFLWISGGSRFYSNSSFSRMRRPRHIRKCAWDLSYSGAELQTEIFTFTASYNLTKWQRLRCKTKQITVPSTVVVTKSKGVTGKSGLQKSGESRKASWKRRNQLEMKGWHLRSVKATERHLAVKNSLTHCPRACQVIAGSLFYRSIWNSEIFRNEKKKN